MIEKTNVETINKLLDEFSKQRDAIAQMVEELDVLKKDIDKLFPERIDARYIQIFEERVKAMTGIFNALLDMRKEITKSIRDEIEVRRRLEKDELGDNEGSVENLFDIRKIAKSVEKFQKKANKMKEDKLKKQKLQGEKDAKEK